MGVVASYTANCDKCGEDTESSHPTIQTAIDHARRGGWEVTPTLWIPDAVSGEPRETAWIVHCEECRIRPRAERCPDCRGEGECWRCDAEEMAW